MAELRLIGGVDCVLQVIVQRGRGVDDFHLLQDPVQLIAHQLVPVFLGISPTPHSTLRVFLPVAVEEVLDDEVGLLALLLLHLVLLGHADQLLLELAAFLLDALDVVF